MSPTVLVADDSRTIRQVVEWALKGSRYDVVGVGTARDAAQAALRGPAIILVDYHLPDASGYDMCRALKRRAETSQIPVVMLGGAYHGFDEALAMQAGADAILTKPFKTDDLLGALEEATRSAAAARPAQPAPAPAAPAAPAPPASAPSAPAAPAPPASAPAAPAAPAPPAAPVSTPPAPAAPAEPTPTPPTPTAPEAAPAPPAPAAAAGPAPTPPGPAPAEPLPEPGLGPAGATARKPVVPGEAPPREDGSSQPRMRFDREPSPEPQRAQVERAPQAPAAAEFGSSEPSEQAFTSPKAPVSSPASQPRIPDADAASAPSRTPPPDANASTRQHEVSGAHPMDAPYGNADSGVSAIGASRAEIESMVDASVRAAVKEALPGLLKTIMGDVFQKRVLPKLVEHAEQRVDTLVANEIDGRIRDAVREEIERLLAE